LQVRVEWVSGQTPAQMVEARQSTVVQRVFRCTEVLTLLFQQGIISCRSGPLHQQAQYDGQNDDQPVHGVVDEISLINHIGHCSAILELSSSTVSSDGEAVHFSGLFH